MKVNKAKKRGEKVGEEGTSDWKGFTEKVRFERVEGSGGRE